MEESIKRRYRLRDVLLKKAVLQNAREMLQREYDSMNGDPPGWGPAIKTENDRWNLCVDLLRAGLCGSFVDLDRRPSREELIAASGMNIVGRK